MAVTPHAVLTVSQTRWGFSELLYTDGVKVYGQLKWPGSDTSTAVQMTTVICDAFGIGRVHLSFKGTNVAILNRLEMANYDVEDTDGEPIPQELNSWIKRYLRG